MSARIKLGVGDDDADEHDSSSLRTLEPRCLPWTCQCLPIAIPGVALTALHRLLL